MNWMNLQTHYRSILSLFLFCAAIILPILILMNPLSHQLMSLTDMEGTTDTPMFVLLTLLNLPLLLSKLNPSDLVGRIYLFLFIILSLGVFVMNPSNVLSTHYKLIPMVGITAMIFFILKYLTHGIFKEILAVFLLLALGVCGESVWSYSPSYKYYYLVFYAVGYIWTMAHSMPELWGGIMEVVSVMFNPIVDSPFKILIVLMIAIIVLTLFRKRIDPGITIPTRIYVIFVLMIAGIGLWQFMLLRSASSQPGLYTILLIEIIVIVLLVYMRTWMKESNGGDLIVHEPLDLNKNHAYKVADHYQYNYTVTFWLYFDAMSPGYSASASGYTDVVLYGDNLLVAYNSSINTLQIIIKNHHKKHAYNIVNVPLQKWNQIALLYANGTFDIFMNGELQKSRIVVPQPSNHEIVVGAENGVRGKLCTMMFYDKVLTMDQLRRLYTEFKDKNPPTV